MARPSSIGICIEYKRHSEAEWYSINLSADEYFWTDNDDPDEIWEVDSVAIHSHAIGYVPEEPKRIEYVRLTVVDPDTDARHTAFYHLWSDGESFSCRVTTEKPGESPSSELIVANSLPFESNCSEVLRWDLTDDEPQLTLNEIMYGRGGDEHSIHVHPPKKKNT